MKLQSFFWRFMEVHDFGLQKARGATRHNLVTSRYKKKRKQRLLPVPVVTMLIKGKKAVSHTWVRSEDLGIEKRREEEKSSERELHHMEKLSVLERMHRLINLISGWTPNQKKSDRGRSRRKEQVPNHDVNPILIFHACV